MEKSVIISVTGNQNTEHGDSNILELVTEGRYYKEDNAYYITYNESEVTGLEGTTTTIKIVDDIVTLMRVGSVNSQFVFQKGRRHISYYDTLQGAFTIGVFANSVDVKMDDNGGEISVDYQIEIDNNKTGYNDFCMSIREAGCSNGKYYREFKGNS
mgnify:CR=1 FL=1